MIKKQLLIAITTFLMGSPAIAFEHPEVVIKEQYGQVNERFSIKSGHTVEVKNENLHDINYYFAVEVCAFNHSCAKHDWSQKVASGAYYRNELGMELPVQFHRSGDKDIWATTFIRGDRDFVKTEHSRVRVS